MDFLVNVDQDTNGLRGLFRIVMLSEKNAHARDANIEFEESTHVYTINGDDNYKSVTTWIHDFFPSFNADLVIQKMRTGKNWGPDNQYYNMTDDEIKSKWSQNGQQAAKLGTEMHANIERYYNNLPYNPGFTDTRECKLFEEFLADHRHLKPYRTEWTVYTKVYRLAGSVDIVYIDPSDANKIVLADWKRCKEIKMTNRWESGYPPLNAVDNCNYWHYTLQLNVYRMILEKYYDKQVSEMFLVVLHPDQEHYRKIPIQRISKEIMAMLQKRKQEISKP